MKFTKRFKFWESMEIQSIRALNKHYNLEKILDDIKTFGVGNYYVANDCLIIEIGDGYEYTYNLETYELESLKAIDE